MKIMVNDGETKYEVDIEPNAENETPHLYVTIITNDKEVYEGNLPRIGKVVRDVKESSLERSINEKK